jgi:hypothetical protein
MMSVQHKVCAFGLAALERSGLPDSQAVALKAEKGEEDVFS